MGRNILIEMNVLIKSPNSVQITVFSRPLKKTIELRTTNTKVFYSLLLFVWMNISNRVQELAIFVHYTQVRLPLIMFNFVVIFWYDT